MKNNPREIILNEPMGSFQVLVIALCVGLCALDGFDVLSISFASPGIAADWQVDRGALGVILSAELVGMALGSAVIGSIADSIGRRPSILMCLVVMTVGMYLASIATGVTSLLTYRFATGLGIGGMLACINAMTAEFSNAKRRSLAVTIMGAGYPGGAIAGGSIAAMLLASHDWRAVFVFGALATGAFIPLVWFLMPESIEFLQHKRPPNVLARINQTLRRMGHQPVDALPERRQEPAKYGALQLFAPGLASKTILLTVVYFAHILTFYFYIKWIPKLVVDMGHAPAAAGGVLVWANVGGICGTLALGMLTQRFGLRGLVVAAMLGSTALVTMFGQVGADLGRLSAIAAAAGFFANSAIVGMYAILAQSFPTALRAGGTGFVIGVGRGGAALAPMFAGFLFVAGATLPMVAAVMGSGSILAAAVLWMLRYRESALDEASGS